MFALLCGFKDSTSKYLTWSQESGHVIVNDFLNGFMNRRMIYIVTVSVTVCLKHTIVLQ